MFLEGRAGSRCAQGMDRRVYTSVLCAYYWRAGASQPSGANGAIFPLLILIYLYIIIFITGAAYVVSNSTLHAHAHAHVKLQSAAYA